MTVSREAHILTSRETAFGIRLVHRSLGEGGHSATESTLSRSRPDPERFAAIGGERRRHVHLVDATVERAPALAIVGCPTAAAGRTRRRLTRAAGARTRAAVAAPARVMSSLRLAFRLLVARLHRQPLARRRVGRRPGVSLDDTRRRRRRLIPQRIDVRAGRRGRRRRARRPRERLRRAPSPCGRRPSRRRPCGRC